MDGAALHIRRPHAAEIEAALTLALQDHDADERLRRVAQLMAAARDHAAALDGLFAGYAPGGVEPRPHALAGAMFSQLQPGRAAECRLPQATEDAAPEIHSLLMAATVAWLDASDAAIAQILCSEMSEPQESALRAGGFTFITELLYLACERDVFPDSLPQIPGEWMTAADDEHPLDQAESTAESARQSGLAAHRGGFARMLTAVVEATYEDSRDCPQLNGLRRTEDVLAGYRATGGFDPSLWFVSRRPTPSGRPDPNASGAARATTGDANTVGTTGNPFGNATGCLLLADHKELNALELVYMGVVPAARGWGLGYDLVRRAQWEARRRGRERLVLAVDAANDAALRVYAASGFRAWERRRVYVRPKRSEGISH